MERRRALEEERAWKEVREEERIQMQVLNDHVVAFLAFKCNIIALLTDFIHEGIGCSEDHATEVAHARF